MAIECKHGRLARKCEHCELDEALTRISALEAERDKAEVERDNLKVAEAAMTACAQGMQERLKQSESLLRGICCQCEVYSLTDKCNHCKKVQAFLASIGGEGQP